ncbi:polysaccharide biosynthesis C-terminal domain-containing protein [Chitinophaga sp.]|uniref:lipopolysaccharide biosynthesis protein n=1 Tax=Chitinophaga sp. TaxID=1869181 RepID=UPI0026055F03|nr:polysaccharide biosynthesis C-terminal domain-containing protein [uncultured Chitinophaga sp.]
MGIIRSQSIRSVIITYGGFAIGALNTYLFMSFVPAEIYGLTRLMASTAMVFYSIASMGTATLLNKFFPYYRDHLAPHKRDLFGIVLTTSLIGFLLVTLGTIVFHDVVVQKYSANSQIFVEYFYLLYPFTFFLMLFTLFENFSYNHFKTIFPIFLKEVGIRVITTLMILLLVLHVFTDIQFIWLYAFIYAAVFIALVLYLQRSGALHFSFRISHVTRKLSDKMISFNLLIFGGSVFGVLAQNIDALVVGSTQGLAATGVLESSTYVSNAIGVPQRSLIAIAIPILAKAWKDKDYTAIQSMYRRSSLTLLIFATFLFMMVWLNLDSAFEILHIPELYLEGRYIILFLGLSKVLDLGTGVNEQIIGTSNMWRFQFYSTLVLLVASIPMNIWLIKLLGITGSGVAALITAVIYNSLRYIFLYYRFNMQPFSLKTLYVVLLAVAGWYVCQFLITMENPWLRGILRTSIFCAIYLVPIIYFKWSQDVTETWRKGLAMLQGMIKRK